MAKFNIEVELDWVDGEDGYTIDEEIKEQVVSGIKDALLKKQQQKLWKQLMIKSQKRFLKRKERYRQP